jgi:DNA invertase Pin-like site-specific DNA recombinase
MLERQREGIAIAKAKGKYKGRQTRFSEDEMERMKSEFGQAKNKAAIARNWGISRQYLYKLAANSSHLPYDKGYKLVNAE